MPFDVLETPVRASDISVASVLLIFLNVGFRSVGGKLKWEIELRLNGEIVWFLDKKNEQK
jgi:hypothetical protein